MGAGNVHRPAGQAQRAAGGTRLIPAWLAMGLSGNDVELGVGKAGDAAIGDRQPRHQVQPAAIPLHVGDIGSGPVEPFGQIGELQRRAGRPVAGRNHRQRRTRRQILGCLWVEHPFGQAAAPQRFIALLCPDNHAAGRPGAQYRLLLGHLAGCAVGAAQRDAALEIGVDQPCGRQQPRIAILLPHTARHAGQDGGFGHQPFGHPFEPDHRFALRQIDRAGFGDQCIAARPVTIDRASCAVRRAIDGDRHGIDPGGNDGIGLHRWSNGTKRQRQKPTREGGNRRPI